MQELMELLVGCHLTVNLGSEHGVLLHAVAVCCIVSGGTDCCSASTVSCALRARPTFSRPQNLANAFTAFPQHAGL